MAYGYLLAPSFQFVNINGRPIANGHIEVFFTNTDTKYITKCDFNGTDNPFKIPLNSKGMAVVIASGDYAYDVFCYDRFGSLFWSGINVTIDNSIGLVIDGAELPMRIVGGKITNNGVGLTCTGTNAWAEGDNTTASGNHSHSEGSRTIASGDNSHAEGGNTRATGEHSHAEGFSTKAGSYGHAEGAGTEASNTASHAEGQDTTASGQASHAEGQDTTASGQASHAEGRFSVASGNYSHASGRGTRATNEGSHAVGKYNDDGDALFVVGNGVDTFHRSDAFKVDRNGDAWVMINGVLTKLTIDVKNKTFNFSLNNIITQTRYNSYLNNSNCEFYLYIKNGIAVLTGWFNPSSNFNVSYNNSDIGGNSSWPVILLLDVTEIDTSNFLSQGSFLFKGDTYNRNFEFICSTLNIVNYNDKKYLSIGVHAVGLNTNRSYNFNPSTLLL